MRDRRDLLVSMSSALFLGGSVLCGFPTVPTRLKSWPLPSTGSGRAPDLRKFEHVRYLKVVEIFDNLGLTLMGPNLRRFD